MHGAGNDYIYINTLLYSIPNPEATSLKWSAPHFGIGSDGLVLIGKPTDETKADFSMHIYNADGSEAMMCGNASRCIGKYLYEKGMTDKTEIRLETLSGIKVLHLTVKEGEVVSVTVDMLEPRFNEPAQFTCTHPKLDDVPGAEEGVFVSMGNPHYVIFVKDIEKVDIEECGSKLEKAEAFPQRCNIEFAQVKEGNEIRTRVWERGSGITMACGTGACATLVAAAMTKRTPRTGKIIMDGGTLEIKWEETDGHVYMTGPAAFVFEGEAEI